VLDVTRLRVLAEVARTGSVTAAARRLHYSQPSVSHHLARLEAETGAQLLQRVGRGVRLTEAGRMLAERAGEIIGRIDAAESELDAHVGLRAGRVRVATFASALVTLIPATAGLLAAAHPGIALELVDTHPPEALQMLRAGEADVAVVFGYDDTADEGFRQVPLFEDPTHLLTAKAMPQQTVAELRDARWIAGCDRFQDNLHTVCGRAGFTPRIRCTTDDVAAIQALVACGLGVALMPGLALRAHRHPDLVATPVPGEVRHIFAATYGEPPDPPPTQEFLAALTAAARGFAA
jgi:molybdate transport repressor ModE-like protein